MMIDDDSTVESHETDIEKARRLIAAIPRPERKSLELKINELSASLIEAKSEGCSYKELAAAVNDAGIPIRESTLRQYICRAKRGASDVKPSSDAKSKAKRKGRRSGGSAGAEAAKPSEFGPPAGAVLPVVLGQQRWKTIDIARELEVGDMLQLAPGGVVDCNGSRVITPRGQKLRFDELPLAFLRVLGLVMQGGPDAPAKALLIDTMWRIDLAFPPQEPSTAHVVTVQQLSIDAA